MAQWLVYWHGTPKTLGLNPKLDLSFPHLLYSIVENNAKKEFDNWKFSVGKVLRVLTAYLKF